MATKNPRVTYKNSRLSSIILHEDNALQPQLKNAGWAFEPINNSNGTQEFSVAYRSRRRQDLAQNDLESTPILSTSRDKTAGRGRGSNAPFGPLREGSTPTTDAAADVLDEAGARETLENLSTLKAVRSGKPSLVFAVDTEFVTPDNREILTWQVSFALPDNDDVLINAVFFSANRDKRLGLGRMLSYLIWRFRLAERFKGTDCPVNGFAYSMARRWIVPLIDTQGSHWDCYQKNSPDWGIFDNFQDAYNACKDPDFLKEYDSSPQPWSLKMQVGKNGQRSLAGYVRDYSQFFKDTNKIPVTVLFHYAPADLTAFTIEDYEKDVMRRVTSVQRGLVTIVPWRMMPRSPASFNFYPLSVTIRDTMAHAPAKMKSLEKLGETVGINKLELPAGYSKDAMDVFLKGDPVSFFEYGTRDADVTLSYAGALYNFNSKIPISATSAAVNVMVKKIKQYLCIAGLENDSELFLRMFRGVERVKSKDKQNGQFVTETEDLPISDDARIIQEYAKFAYKGGMNGCSDFGWIDVHTYDVDLCAAYPTVMFLVQDPDYDSDDLIMKTIENEWATLDDIDDPFQLGFFNVDHFEFPEEVQYPTIAVKDGERTVFLRSAREARLYCHSSEIWAALQLGAKVHIKRGFIARPRMNDDGTVSHSLSLGIKSFVEDRNTIKSLIADGFDFCVVFEQLEKTFAASIYGKTGQNIRPKNSWNAWKQLYERIGFSKISSAPHACSITAVVRVILALAVNELDRMGYKSYSYTTDGFITEAPADVVNNLYLFGLTETLRQARTELVGDPKVWEVKHEQDALGNFSTRCNVSPTPGGVLARNSYKVPDHIFNIKDEDEKDLKDREHFLQLCLAREGKIKSINKEFPSFHDISIIDGRADFNVKETVTNLSMDFDLKRKPIKESMVVKQVPFKGSTYEVACFETVPYENMEEETLYHSVGENMQCLRTAAEWDKFFMLVEAKLAGIELHVKNTAWSKLTSCVRGHRRGKWTIPTLDDPNLTVADKCDWVNSFNFCDEQFTKENWKNCARKDRESSMVPVDFLKSMLDEMGAVLE